MFLFFVQQHFIATAIFFSILVFLKLFICYFIFHENWKFIFSFKNKIIHGII
jgi:hypothetical protein